MSPLVLGTIVLSLAVLGIAIWAIMSLTARRRQLSASRLAELNAQRAAETGTETDAGKNWSQGGPGLSGQFSVNQPGSAAGMGGGF